MPRRGNGIEMKYICEIMLCIVLLSGCSLFQNPKVQDAIDSAEYIDGMATQLCVFAEIGLYNFKASGLPIDKWCEKKENLQPYIDLVMILAKGEKPICHAEQTVPSNPY